MSRITVTMRHLIAPVLRHSGLVVVVALLLGVASFYLAKDIRIDTDFAELLPSSYPSVQALERLRETVGGESEVAVAITSPSFEANKQFAEDFIPRALALQEPESGERYLTRVEYRRDTEFLQNNALYFATSDELDTLDLYLRDQIQQARLEANPFYFELDDFDEDELDDGETAHEDSTGIQLAVMYEEIVGQEYPVSEDSTTMVLRFFPSGSQTNIGFIDALYADLEALTGRVRPTSYHPEMEITFGGRLLRQSMEVRAITGDVLGSFGVGASLVLLLVLTYFCYKMYSARAGGQFSARALWSSVARVPALALLIGLPLLLSLTWTFALAFLALGSLNLMTSTLGLVLFGLGIDYGIHFFARYSEERGHGRSVRAAAEETVASTGQAIAVGALTTSLALFILMIADFRGFSEFGFMAGTGIIFALLAMLIVMPALIVLLERYNLIKLDSVLPPEAGRFQTGQRYPGARSVLVGSLVLSVVAIAFIPGVEFQYRFGELEPRYREYEERHEVISRVGNEGRRNPAYVVVDTPEEVPAVVRAVREYARQDTLTPTIASVESLQDRFPMTDRAREERLAKIAAVRELLDDPFLLAEESLDLDRLRRAAQTTRPLTLDDVPESLRKRYTSKTGEVGNFVMIYPSVGLSDGRNSMAFAEDVGRIVTEDGKVYHAGSTSLVAADMLRLMLKEAPWMVTITLMLVALLMLIYFRSLKWAAVALIPLVLGVLWMIFLMEVFGVKLNFYNLVVLPAILGIGNDAGVHLVHRYREEGRGSIVCLLKTTGEHVAMGSITTIVGFGGLLLSFHPGLRSIGLLAVLGIGATLVAALTLLPAMVQFFEDRTRASADADAGGDGTDPALGWQVSEPLHQAS